MRCNLCSGVSYCVKQKTEGNITRRIYRCKKCHNVFHTVEKIEDKSKNEIPKEAKF